MKPWPSPAFAERVASAKEARERARQAFRLSFLRCALAGRWASMGWSPAYPLYRKLVGFRS